jgi:hypothetical protein
VVELYGSSTTFNQMIIHESIWADEYADKNLRSYIREEYKKRHMLELTPLTHPQKYDPCRPPNGWRYDPYYEIWLKTNNE